MPSILEDISELQPYIVQVWEQDPGVASSGQWVTLPNLRCLNIRQVVHPGNGMSTANFLFHWGNMDYDGTGFAWQDPYDLLNRWVRVAIFNDDTGLLVYWCGAVTSFEDRDFSQAPNGIPYGDQVFQAVGPEWLLSRKQITSSYVFNHGTGFVTVNAGLSFNSLGGRLNAIGIQPNKASAAAAFTTDIENAIPWTSALIVDYLWLHLFPTTLDLVVGPTFISPLFTWLISGAENLSPFIPVLDVHGRSVYDVLSELVDPRRFMQFRVSYTPHPANETNLFGIFTLAVSSNSQFDIVLPSGAGTIVGNPNTIALSTSDRIEARISQVGDATLQYGQVIVQGAKKGFIVTRALTNMQGWTVTEENAYASEVTAATDTDEQEYLLANARARYPNVWQRFVTAVNNDFTTSEYPQTSEFRITTPQYVPGLRYSRSMPLKINWDYSLVTPAPQFAAFGEQEYRDMFVVVKLRDAPTGTEVYGVGAMLSAAGKSELYIDKNEVHPITVTPLDDYFGFHINVSTEPHYLAKDRSPAIASTDSPSVFNWETDLWVTGYFQTDDFVEVRYPSAATVTNNANELTIRLGDTAFLDVLAAGTVVDVVDGVRTTAPNDIAVRDDRVWMAAIARMAYQWYAMRRYAFSFEYAKLVFDVFPGQILSSADGLATDIIVTDVIFDMENRTTAIATNFVEPAFELLGTNNPNVAPRPSRAAIIQSGRIAALRGVL